MLNGCLSQAAKPGLQWFFLLRVPFLSLIVRHTLGGILFRCGKSQEGERDSKPKVTET